MRKLIMLAVLGAGLTLAGTSDAKANHRWHGGGWHRPHYGYSYYSPRYYGYSYYRPQYYGYGYSSPRYYSSYYSPGYYGYGRYGGYGYGGYGSRRGFSLYVGPGGFSVGYNRFRW